MRLGLSLLVSVLSLAACQGTPTRSFSEPQKLGGKTVAAEVLNDGHVAYMNYCRACHGDAGDGKGPASFGLRPSPRDFTTGIFKFGSVPAGTLPRDEDLERIVRDGLHGTAMLPWDMPALKVAAVIQYIKIFSPRWKEEEPGEAIAVAPDPWAGKTPAAVARGRKLYHGLAQCLGCHPAYATKQEIDAASRELSGAPTVDFRADMYGPALKDSDYGFKILSPDFTRAEMRSVRNGHRTADLYRVIAAGVGGTAMPSWKGQLPDDDLWALVHYVESLVALRNRPELAELQQRIQGAPPAAPRAN